MCVLFDVQLDIFDDSYERKRIRWKITGTYPIAFCHKLPLQKRAEDLVRNQLCGCVDFLFYVARHSVKLQNEPRNTEKNKINHELVTKVKQPNPKEKWRDVAQKDKQTTNENRGKFFSRIIKLIGN